MSFLQIISALGCGASIGFTVAAPIGPMGTLCIQRTLSCGALTGLATGLGAATVHLAYGAIAVLGPGSLAQRWMQANSLVFGVLSGIVLLWFAIRARPLRVKFCETTEIDRIRLIQVYLSAIALGVTNPLTIILFFAALPAFADQSTALSLVAGVFLGSTAWWIILSVTVAKARSRLDASILALSSRLVSLILLALGVFALLRTAERAFGRIWA
jgi:threonine/homoserine/homoserine lactone efflux protein